MPEDFITGEGFPLGDWIQNERFRHRYGRITPRQEQYLNEIGMLWTKFDVRWERSFQAVCSYAQSHGNLRIPQDYFSKDGVNLNVPMKYVIDGIWLGRWLYFLRKRKNTLRPEQIARLDRIGMRWNIQTR